MDRLAYPYPVRRGAVCLPICLPICLSQKYRGLTMLTTGSSAVSRKPRSLLRHGSCVVLAYLCSVQRSIQKVPPADRRPFRSRLSVLCVVSYPCDCLTGSRCLPFQLRFCGDRRHPRHGCCSIAAFGLGPAKALAATEWSVGMMGKGRLGPSRIETPPR